MILCAVRDVPVTFCFTINWTGPDTSVAAMFGKFREATAGVLQEVAKRVRQHTLRA